MFCWSHAPKVMPQLRSVYALSRFLHPLPSMACHYSFSQIHTYTNNRMHVLHTHAQHMHTHTHAHSTHAHTSININPLHAHTHTHTYTHVQCFVGSVTQCQFTDSKGCTYTYYTVEDANVVLQSVYVDSTPGKPFLLFVFPFIHHLLLSSLMVLPVTCTLFTLSLLLLCTPGF